ncbi:MAG: hypothetical protein AAGH38_05700, partial [Pseudomonadota bacterium]
MIDSLTTNLEYMMSIDLKHIADRPLKKPSPAARVTERQRSEAAALKDLEDARLEKRRMTNKLRQ